MDDVAMHAAQREKNGRFPGFYLIFVGRREDAWSNWHYTNARLKKKAARRPPRRPIGALRACSIDAPAAGEMNASVACIYCSSSCGKRPARRSRSAANESARCAHPPAVSRRAARRPISSLSLFLLPPPGISPTLPPVTILALIRSAGACIWRRSSSSAAATDPCQVIACTSSYVP